MNSVDTTHYAYDAKGNLYGGYGILRDYNYRNQPTEMFNADSVTYNYGYNSNGERVKKKNINNKKIYAIAFPKT